MIEYENQNPIEAVYATSFFVLIFSGILAKIRKVNLLYMGAKFVKKDGFSLYDSRNTLAVNCSLLASGIVVLYLGL